LTYIPMSSDGIAWMGFTAAGGLNSSQDHDLFSWNYDFRTYIVFLFRIIEKLKIENRKKKIIIIIIIIINN